MSAPVDHIEQLFDDPAGHHEIVRLRVHEHGEHPAGTVLAACEAIALGSGRKLVRDSLQTAIQGRADSQKKRPDKGTKATDGVT